MIDPNKIAKIIIEKVINKDKSDEENIEHLATYLKHRQYEIISDTIAKMRRASKHKEDEILQELETLDK